MSDVIDLIAVQYKDHHREDDCKGTFERKVLKELRLPVDVLGVKLVKNVKAVGCDTCGSLFIDKDFQRELYEGYYNDFLSSQELLTNKALRYLRVWRGLSRVQVSKDLSILVSTLELLEKGELPIDGHLNQLFKNYYKR